MLCAIPLDSRKGNFIEFVNMNFDSTIFDFMDAMTNRKVFCFRLKPPELLEVEFGLHLLIWHMGGATGDGAQHIQWRPGVQVCLSEDACIHGSSFFPGPIPNVRMISSISG